MTLTRVHSMNSPGAAGHRSYSDPAVRGWIEAAGCVTCIGAISLLYAIGHTQGAHPIAFILYAVLVSAIATLALVGAGPHALAIVRYPMSWTVGLCMILLEVFYFQTLTYVPPVHGNVMLRIATPIAMVAGWMLFRRRARPLAIAGALVIVVATLFLIGVTAPDVRWPMAGMGTLAAVFLVARGFATEIHPWNRDARTVRDKLRVTGLILLVTSMLSLVLAAIVASGSGHPDDAAHPARADSRADAARANVPGGRPGRRRGLHADDVFELRLGRQDHDREPDRDDGVLARDGLALSGAGRQARADHGPYSRATRRRGHRGVHCRGAADLLGGWSGAWPQATP